MSCLQWLSIQGRERLSEYVVMCTDIRSLDTPAHFQKVRSVSSCIETPLWPFHWTPLVSITRTYLLRTSNATSPTSSTTQSRGDRPSRPSRACRPANTRSQSAAGRPERAPQAFTALPAWRSGATRPQSPHGGRLSTTETRQAGPAPRSSNARTPPGPVWPVWPGAAVPRGPGRSGIRTRRPWPRR